MDLNFKPQDENLRRWTQLAKECYSINCICFRCDFIPKRFKDICMVKNYVLELYKRYGKPI